MLCRILYVSESSVEAKVAYLLKMIEHINIVLERHKGVDNALEDEVEARTAIMMSLMQIGETMNKLDAPLLEQYDLLSDAKGAYSVRNFIAHDYEGVDVALMAEIIRDNLPKLEEKLQILKQNLFHG